ncbi:TPA: hypothetical protein ACNHDD_004999 [Escherichia coli]
MRVIDSMAELKKTQPENQSEIVYLKAYFSGGNAGGGFFAGIKVLRQQMIPGIV